MSLTGLPIAALQPSGFHIVVMGGDTNLNYFKTISPNGVSHLKKM